MPSYHIVVKGKVQGVFFRQTAKEVALENDVRGWVRNTDEGTVEAKVTGREEDLFKFISWCRKGPSQAEVEDVELYKIPDEEFVDFKVVRGS